MLKYLEYVTNELSKSAPELLEEIQIYKDMYIKYEKSALPSPLYNGSAHLFNTHNFILPTNENISISWDIDLIYKKISHCSSTKYLSLSEFETIFANDLEQSKEEFVRIYAEVNSIHSHNYNDILTIHFKPFHCNLILDGRHRYTEFKKFKPDDSINVSFLDSNDFIDCIISASDLTNYIILNNIDEINNYILGKGKLEQVINFKLCNL